MESKLAANKMIALFSNAEIWPNQWSNVIPIFLVQSNPLAVVSCKLFCDSMQDNFELYDVRFPDNMYNPYGISFDS